jgi:hypothetical protein
MSAIRLRKEGRFTFYFGHLTAPEVVISGALNVAKLEEC